MSQTPDRKGDDSRDMQRVDRTAFSVCDLADQDNDLQYWLSRTPEERLEALEFMRQMLYGTDPAGDRLQRVLEVADLAPG